MPFHLRFDVDSQSFYGYWFEGWLDVVGFEEKYEINHLSQVRNKASQKVLKPRSDLRVTLMKCGKKYMKCVYHLALLTFFPHIPRNNRTVDHIDENHFNNVINNLQWLDIGSNSQKSNKLKPRNTGQARAKPVEQWSKDNTMFIQSFASTIEAARETKINQGSISNCARGKDPSAGGYFWRFTELESQQNLPDEKWKTNEILQSMLPSPKVMVSNMGRIMTASGIKTKGSKIKDTSHRDFQGYGVHQLVWTVWGDGRLAPKRGESLVICHNDSIPKDADGCSSNAIENLRLDTQSENAKEYQREKAKKRNISQLLQT